VPDVVSPELAARVVKEFILPMFEKDIKTKRPNKITNLNAEDLVSNPTLF
jgi:hypothetical protein